MAKEYLIEKIDESKFENGVENTDIWSSAQIAKIDCFPWNKNNYMPETEARLLYSDTHLHVFFKAFEKQIQAEHLNMNDPVSRDSCVEFFINPDPESDTRYLNFEVNVIGTLLLGIGDNRHNRYKMQDIPSDLFNIRTSVTKESLATYNNNYWFVKYSIPFSFIKKSYGDIEFKPGKKMKANFYKCGGQYRHFGCWNPITWQRPDFHRPEFFGILKFN